MNANTCTPEDVFARLGTQYQLSPLLKLRGTLAYRAAKLAGMVLQKEAKLLREANGALGYDESIHEARNIFAFNAVDAAHRGEDDERSLVEDMGLETSDMKTQLRAMVMYSNKLNFDMLELVDPSGDKRMTTGFKVRGVYHDDNTQWESWLSSVQLHAEAKDEFDIETYDEYVTKLDSPDFAMSEAQWNELNQADANVYAVHSEDIVDLIVSIGDDECDFDELPVRTQIGLIESMRSKLDAIKDSCVRSVKYARMDRADKIAEASKLVGIVSGMDRQFCDMLDSSRYANYAEYMYNYTPNQRAVNTAQVKTRRIVLKQQPAGRVSDVAAQIENGIAPTDIERDAPPVGDVLWNAAHSLVSDEV